MLGAKLPIENFLKAIFAGKATITIKNAQTGNRFTYKVKQGVANPEAFHVSLLNGPDNESDFIFIGSIIDKVRYAHSSRTNISADKPSVMGFAWVVKTLAEGKVLPEHVELWHEGTCCACGRKLTVPESIKSGFGEHCMKRLGMI